MTLITEFHEPHGIYLEGHPPERDQWREGRRDPIKPVIVWHTSESSSSWSAYDLVEFIRQRSDPGSYHLVGDAAGTIIHAIDFANEAYGDRTGSNKWAIHCSLVMRHDEWRQLDPDRDRLRNLTIVAGRMSQIAADWIHAGGHGRPSPRVITKAQSDLAGASGFISHAARDHGRRKDPGAGFPWNDVIRLYSMTDLLDGPARDLGQWAQIQHRLDELRLEPGPIDDDPGVLTAAAVERALDALEVLDEAAIDLDAALGGLRDYIEGREEA